METEAFEKPCKANEGIACSNKINCSHCGWNPEVAKKRTENYLNKCKEETL